MNSRAAFGFRPTPGPANLASKVGSWPFQVAQPSAILILPALVNRMPPKTSSMYPSSISRALCRGGMRCIQPLAPSQKSLRGLMAAPLGLFSEYAPAAAGIKPYSLPRSNWSQSPILRAQQTPPNLPGTTCRSFCPNASPYRQHPTNDQLGRHSTCKCSNPYRKLRLEPLCCPHPLSRGTAPHEREYPRRRDRF